MAIAGLTPPSNLIVWQGSPRLITRKIETGSVNTIPGALVVNGSSVGEVGLAGVGATAPLGWLGFEQTPAKYIDGHTRATAYSTDDLVAVLFGGGFGIMAVLKAANSVVEGDFAVSAANGQVAKASAATVTIASGDATVKSDKAQPDEAVDGAYGAEGRILGQFMDTKAATGLVMLWSNI